MFYSSFSASAEVWKDSLSPQNLAWQLQGNKVPFWILMLVDCKWEKHKKKHMSISRRLLPHCRINIKQCPFVLKAHEKKKSGKGDDVLKIPGLKNLRCCRSSGFLFNVQRLKSYFNDLHNTDVIWTAQQFIYQKIRTVRIRKISE